MGRKPKFLSNVPLNDEEKLIFDRALKDAEQDHKRIRALQKHYRLISEKKLPLEYGHVLILMETLKQRFLTSAEKALLACLLERANVDYTFTCYDKKGEAEERRKRDRQPIQMDMFPSLYDFSWSELPIR